MPRTIAWTDVIGGRGGCRRYPTCTFTAYHKPVAEPCPSCGRAYLLEKETKKEGRVLFCDNEGCEFKKTTAAA